MKLTILIIDLPEIIKKYFPLVRLSDYRTCKPFTLSRNNALSNLFHSRELITVNNFKTFKRQIEWICGRLAIKKIIESITRDHYPGMEILIETKENGAPFLPAFPRWGISISHSNACVIGALCMEPDVKLGIDVEKIDPSVADDFYRIAFTPREINLIKKKRA